MVITSCIVVIDPVPTTLGRKQMTSAEHTDGFAPAAQVTITGRNVEVPEHFQERVNAKLA